MKIYVTAKPKKKRIYVEQIDSNHYVVAVAEPAQQGKANRAITEALAKYFEIPKSQVVLINGETSHLKTFKVPDNLVSFVPKLKQNKLF